MEDNTTRVAPGPGLVLGYAAVGFVTLYLVAYVFTVSLTGVPEWIIPDSLGPALLRDMALRWQPWVFGVLGAWIGYKVGRLPIKVN